MSDTNEMSPVKVAEILDAAAAHIDRVGWLQEDYYAADLPPTDCRVCAMGAINVAMFGHPFPPEDSHAYAVTCDLGDLVLEHLGVLGLDLAAWNDEPHRTQDDVTGALRETAAQLRHPATTDPAEETS
ncbi:DUF6197 family protein [Streptomyces prasinus]|uniref:DUF6197 family protein n=1 Tax=Streptomyces prasinus TaxID=67345 RepID=UPI0033ADD08E